MIWASALPWVPTAAVTAMGLIACGVAIVRPERPRLHRIGRAAVLACAAAAVAATIWEGRHEQRAYADGMLPRLHQAVDRLAAVAKLLPANGSPPSAAFASIDAGFAVLANQSDALERQITAYRKATAARTIDAATAVAMIAYLRPLGPHRIVVSCVPGDVEAYDYANRIATILQRAGWDASGPEATTIFGTGAAMGVSLYVRAGTPPEAAHQLLAAFARFNIPHESRVASNDEIPDAETVELFVSRKP